MKKTIIITAIIAVTAVLALILFTLISENRRYSWYFAEASEGKFEIALTVTGELMAEKSVDILAPSIVREEESQQQQGQRGQRGEGGQGGGGGQSYIAGLSGDGGARSGSVSQMITQGGGRGNEIRLAPLRITDMVPEGTIVKKGDFVAQLDKTEYDNTLKTSREQLSTQMSMLELRILDSAVMLTGLRDDIKNQIFLISEAEMKFRNSKFEAPDVIRKAEINLEKAKRLLEQRERTYVLRQAQTLQNILNMRFQIAQVEGTIKRLEELLTEFTVRAPEDGMVIYFRDQLGIKRKTGSMVPPFDRVIATIPDLSVMLSKIYISEIDISKITLGLPVEISLDAFPGKSLRGEIISIANIGETLTNSDSKVYEAIIKIDGVDPILRPSMTTSNKIIIKVIDNTVFVPTEAIYSTTDSIPFVYTRSGLKQVVIPGETNEKMTVVRQGLKPGTRVYVIEPHNPDRFRLSGKDLIPVIREMNRNRLAGRGAENM